VGRAGLQDEPTLFDGLDRDAELGRDLTVRGAALEQTEDPPFAPVRSRSPPVQPGLARSVAGPLTTTRVARPPDELGLRRGLADVSERACRKRRGDGLCRWRTP
jgi:hypothetical protein